MRKTLIFTILTISLFSAGCVPRYQPLPAGPPHEGNAINRAETVSEVNTSPRAAVAIPLIGKHDRHVFFEATVPVPGPNEIWLHGMEYRPGTITVPAGTTVTWINVDETPHDVCSVTGLFLTTLAQGVSFNYTFLEPGIYGYWCECNPGMEGIVVVQ